MIGWEETGWIERLGVNKKGKDRVGYVDGYNKKLPKHRKVG